MQKKPRSHYHGAMPRPCGDAQNEQIKRLRTFNLTPSVSKTLRDRMAYAYAVLGLRVGVSVVRQIHALFSQYGAHQPPAIVGRAASLVLVRQADPRPDPCGDQRKRPGEFVGIYCCPGTCWLKISDSCPSVPVIDSAVAYAPCSSISNGPASTVSGELASTTMNVTEGCPTSVLILSLTLRSALSTVSVICGISSSDYTGRLIWNGYGR